MLLELRLSRSTVPLPYAICDHQKTSLLCHRRPVPIRAGLICALGRDTDAEVEQHKAACAPIDHQEADAAKHLSPTQQFINDGMQSGSIGDQEQPEQQQRDQQVLGPDAFQALLSVWVYIAAGGVQGGHEISPDPARLKPQESRPTSPDNSTGSRGPAQQDEEQQLEFDPDLFGGVLIIWLTSAAVLFLSARAAGFDRGEAYRIACGLLLGLLLDRGQLKFTPYSMIAQDALRVVIRARQRTSRSPSTSLQQATKQQVTGQASDGSTGMQQEQEQQQQEEEEEEEDAFDVVLVSLLSVKLAQLFLFTLAVYRLPQWLAGWDSSAAQQLSLGFLWGVLLTSLVVLPLCDWLSGEKPGR